MGKAQKQEQNITKKVIARKKADKDFQQMINEMEDAKGYKVKQKDHYLCNGAQLPGAFWKQMFKAD